MGTSASNSGPNDKTPLLPAWAQANPVGEPPSAPSEGNTSNGEELPQQPESISPREPTGADPQAPGDTVPKSQPTRLGPWSLARRAMSSVARGGGGARRLTVASRRYVSAKGGAKKAATSASAGRATTGGLGNFLADLATRGFSEAARSLGLQTTVGQKVDVVLAAVLDAIAPAGTTNDQAIARRAASETLCELFEKHGVEQTGVEALNSMKPTDVADAIEVSVSAYVYQRWLFDLSLKIEEHAVSESEAVRLERDVKLFVRGLVKLKLNGSQVLNLDWKGAAGKAFVQDIYEAAYRLLGGTS